MLWGAFFLEHLSEWFLNSGGSRPPAWVWAQQVAHGLMIVGLAMLWHWERAGTLVTLVGSAAFFGPILGGVGLELPLLNLAPLLCLGLAAWLEQAGTTRGETPVAPAG
jgi:hypothetical protein